MTERHPEVVDVAAFEPTIGEQMRLDTFLAGTESLDRDELLRAVQLLARHFYVTHPATVRWLAKEATHNLIGS